jgi:hypothetical protein
VISDEWRAKDIPAGAIMPINHDEIVEEIEGHIRKFGGGFGEWCVGTAKDSRGPFFRRHLAADLGDGLIYREAFTTSAAEQVIDHLVNACGLKLAPEAERGLPSTTECRAEQRSATAERCSALQNTIAPGKIVFVYRPAREAISHQLSVVSKSGTSLGSY